ADSDMVLHVCSCGSIPLDLHADAITLRRFRSRERVAAKEWPPTGRRMKTHDYVLAWQTRLQWPAVRAVHRQREDIRRFAIDRHHCERANPRRSGMRSRRRHKARITARTASALTVQQRLERRAPSG